MWYCFAKTFIDIHKRSVKENPMLLGLDLGTGSAKALLLDSDGTILAEASRPYAVHAPHDGWAESDPNDWWNAIVQASREVVQSHATAVKAIGLSGQMHSVVICDAAGRALRNAILWADGRASEQLNHLRRLEPTLLRQLENPLVVGMSLPTLMWLREAEPETYRLARHALQPKDWLAHRLTGQIQTDPSDASATLMYDLQHGTWHETLLEHLQIRQELLAPIQPSSSVSGGLNRVAASELGVPHGIPVVVGAGDTAAALIGSGLTAPKIAQLTIGTGAQIVTLRSSPQGHPALCTHLYRNALPLETGAPWYAMAAMQNAGLALESVRNWLGLSWPEAYQEAFSVPAGNSNLMFYPYLTGERSPHNNPHLRGGWVGLSLSHRRADLMRAAFEGVAFAIRDGLNALEEVQTNSPAIRIAGGGAQHPTWQQLLSDILERPLLNVDAKNASARGAALLAGLGTGLIAAEGLQTFAPNTTLATEPNKPTSAVYAATYDRFRQTHDALRQISSDTPYNSNTDVQAQP
jgi:xylulokinase